MEIETEKLKETEGEQIASSLFSLAEAVSHRDGHSLAGMVEVLAQSVAGDFVGDNLTTSLGRLTDAQERNAAATYALAEAIRDGFSELANAIMAAKR
jgi:hypothetical protein